MSSSLIAAILLWELFVNVSGISPIVLVKPSDIVPVIFSNYQLLLKELIYTFSEAFWGWLIANTAAFLLAIVISTFKPLAKSVISLGVVINAIPLIALAAILGGFVGTDQNAKTVIVAILCFFPMLIVATSAFSNVNGDYKNLFKTYNSKRSQTFLKLILPSSLPAIFTVLKLNVINAISTAVVSEFFGAHGGIGQFILARKGFFDLPMVWAAIFFIILAGSVFYFSVELARKLVINWS